MSQEQASQVFEVISMEDLYRGFSVENEEWTNVLCVVISKLLKPFPYSTLIITNQDFLLQGLNHFTPAIRCLSLEQLEKSTVADDSVSAMVNSQAFPLLLTTLAFNDIGTATKAAAIVQKATLFPSGINAFTSGMCPIILQQLSNINETVSFRIYDLLIHVIVASESVFRQCESSGLLGPIIEKVKSKDILVKLNTIELLYKLTTTAWTRKFMEENILSDLSTELELKEEDITAGLTISACIRIFGSLYEQEPAGCESFERRYSFLQRLTQCLESNDKQVVEVAIVSIGTIGSFKEGLSLILNSPALKVFLDNYYYATGDNKIKFIRSLSKMLGVTGSEDPEIEQMTEKVYSRIEDRSSPLLSFIKLAQQPMIDTRVAVYSVLQSMASHCWGQKMLVQSSEFIGFILDRENEQTSEGQTWKYAIVKMLVTVPESTILLGDHYTLFQMYSRQGPFYRPLEASVALDNI
ncbi:26S proteasome non-ATPase regulatory subunit 5 [Spinellus fusiger]|nr:26S proteasome non-ATPase regulatory subunit 5 [Spinellus fusiger]